jgi:hypothetical protein
MTDEATLADFERWMVQSGYRPSTVQRSVQEARQLFVWTDEKRALPRRLVNTTKRLLKFFDKYDIEPQGRLAAGITMLLASPADATPLEKRRAQQAKKKRQQTSYRLRSRGARARGHGRNGPSCGRRASAHAPQARRGPS